MDRTDGCTDRIDVGFSSGAERCAAWLYPGRGDGPRPCVILAHGFGGVREARLDAYAERFAGAGITALVFDYRHFGGSDGDPRQLIDISRQLDDWRAAISFARALPDVDPSRIALWGTSFSGGHVAAIAAEDAGIAAAISQAPFMDGVWVLRAAGAANMARMTWAGLRDELRRLAGRPPHLVPIVGPPGTTAAMSSPDAEPGYRALFEPGREFRNEFAARALLRVGTYRPLRHAGHVRCPWLVIVCMSDVVTPPTPALAAAARAPRGEVRRYDAGHFDVYMGTLFELAVAEQIDFLRRHLLDGRSVPETAADREAAAAQAALR